MTGSLDLPLWVVLLASLGLLLAANEAGRALAHRLSGPRIAYVATFHDAVVGLLSLITVFTFAMSLERYDARRQAMIDEANAIGTAALRARLLPPPHDRESLALLHDYALTRVEIGGIVPTAQQLGAAIEKSNAIQERLWQHAKTVAAKDNGFVPTGVYIQALNQLIDLQLSRVANYQNRVPGIVMIVLYAIAIVAAGVSGYTVAMQAPRARVPAYALSAITAVLLTLIQDIDRPGEGYVRVSQQPMVETAAGIAAYRD